MKYEPSVGRLACGTAPYGLSAAEYEFTTAVQAWRIRNPGSAVTIEVSYLVLRELGYAKSVDQELTTEAGVIEFVQAVENYAKHFRTGARLTYPEELAICKLLGYEKIRRGGSSTHP